MVVVVVVGGGGGGGGKVICWCFPSRFWKYEMGEIGAAGFVHFAQSKDH